MDKAIETMIANLRKNTGLSLEQWIEDVNKKGFAKHTEAVKYLKEERGLTHGFANLIVHKAKGSDADSKQDKNDLVAGQFKGKEHFRPVYDQLIKIVTAFGNDVEIAPKNTYVSLRRKKQFAMLTPATKTRFEVGVNLKGEKPKGKLEAITASNAMCSHKINITDLNDVDEEVVSWIKLAYEKAG